MGIFKRRWLYSLAFCGILILSGFAGNGTSLAQEGAAQFKKGAVYDIYYEVSSFELNVLENVRITDTLTVGGVTFLAVEDASPIGRKVVEKVSYININSIKSVLAHGLVPKRMVQPKS